MEGRLRKQAGRARGAAKTPERKKKAEKGSGLAGAPCTQCRDETENKGINATGPR